MRNRSFQFLLEIRDQINAKMILKTIVSGLKNLLFTYIDSIQAQNNIYCAVIVRCILYFKIFCFFISARIHILKHSKVLHFFFSNASI